MHSSSIEWLRQSLARWAGIVLLVAAVGCGQDEIKVYRAAKESPPPPPGALPAGHPDTPTPTAPRLSWKLPADWEETAAGEMRAASFRVRGQDGKLADVGIFPLPGLAGGDLSNVNRWRAQVGLLPVSEEELTKIAQPVEISGQTAQLYEQAGETPGSGEKSRILAAILRREGVAWFFKMTGDDVLVGQQRPAFVDFLKSLSFTATQPTLPPSHPPIDDAGMSAQSAPAAISAEGKPSWHVPPGWQEVPAGPFLIAKFSVTGEGSNAAAVNVSTSAGDGGGLVGNVNRWRTQLGLAELSESDIQKLVATLDADGGKAMLVDMTGTDAKTGQKARLVGAVVPQSKRTWFYKLMGDVQVVERQKEAFTRFVQSAKYAHAS